MGAYALVADLIASRRQSERTKLAATVEAALHEANRRHEGAFYAPLETTRGLDEVSALLADPGVAFDVAYYVNLRVWPAVFRFALGYGEIDVGAKSGRAADMDGSAFHCAASALARGREGGRFFTLEVPGLSTYIRDLIESIGTLHAGVMAGWSDAAVTLLRTYDAAGERRPTQGELGTRLGKSQQAISQALRRARVDTLEQARQAVRNALATLPVAKLEG